MSWFSDEGEPDGSQTSRVRTTALSSADVTDVTPDKGVTREMIKAQRSNMLIFLIG